ncbi:MAG: helix-turn-helix transcriptional regulator, partial [Lachnospiraceae bacterium]|nr:helix-turn-helix transcriptional regulator [Lachnospiraceae bacterium]
MKEDKDSRAVSSEADQDFLQFLRQVRKEENVRLEQLAEGLMTVSHLARIEKGQRPICKNMRDRLLGRLGVASDLYENLLNIEDYIAWQQQRNILSAIERRDFVKAQELLDVYAEQKPRFKDKIKQQFCLVMRA